MKKIYFFLIRRLEARLLKVWYPDRLKQQLLERAKEQGLYIPEFEGLEVRTTRKLKALESWLVGR